MRIIDFYRLIVIFFKRYHLAVIIPIGTVYVGLCAWTYSSAYYQQIGITVSYSVVDNILFFFENARKVGDNFIENSHQDKFVEFILFGLIAGLAINILFKIRAILFVGIKDFLEMTFWPKITKMNLVKKFSDKNSLIGRTTSFCFDGSSGYILKTILISSLLWVFSSLNFSALQSS